MDNDCAGHGHLMPGGGSLGATAFTEMFAAHKVETPTLLAAYPLLPSDGLTHVCGTAAADRRHSFKIIGAAKRIISALRASPLRGALRAIKMAAPFCRTGLSSVRGSNYRDELQGPTIVIRAF